MSEVYRSVYGRAQASAARPVVAVGGHVAARTARQVMAKKAILAVVVCVALSTRAFAAPAAVEVETLCAWTCDCLMIVGYERSTRADAHVTRSILEAFMMPEW